MQRERSAWLTSKYGFSVVAPISVTRPSSTACRTESCWRLSKRWISSMKRSVRSPFAPSRSRARASTRADVVHAGRHGRELLEGRRRRLGDDPRDRRLPDPGRPVQDHRRRPPLVDRPTQGAARAEHAASDRRARPASAAGCRCGSGATASARSAAASLKRSLTRAVCSPRCPPPARISTRRSCRARRRATTSGTSTPRSCSPCRRAPTSGCTATSCSSRSSTSRQSSG